MTGIVNLRQARKRRARTAERALADANAARHGIAKANREITRTERARETRILDGHERRSGTTPDTEG